MLLLVLPACVKRIPIYSPRQTNTEAHREARAPDDCIGCHDISQRVHHSNSDDCTRCHKISKGY